MNAPDFSQATWHKSNRSNGGGGACVEVATIPSITGVRDSKLGEASPVLPFATAGWSTFLLAIKGGTFNR
ncbi:DUF397 domain-containing protein [Saccharopolyspora gloriosae]|uniref:DUF397 domain-containing protein n=1 Tax=Saccharopolyspora gloriosae TaxID=455344 RepID=A0A840NHA7_9PSEU|nr:DUF397 domain-containing protein [Saccharopolyspora gloriosae]MBB5070411.1 hypothetical protein [Saccharopolyspora gloriosae]